MQGEEQPHESAPPRIVVADDHPLFRAALLQMLSALTDFAVVGEAADGQEAVELCRRLRPEVVLMDVRMPKSELPRTIVLVLTASEELNHLSSALEAGAAGYMLKTSPPKQIIEAVHKALAGESPLNPELATRLLLKVMEKAPKRGATEEQSLRLRSLSPREAEVLRLMSRGYTNQQISRELFLSVSTVKKHVRNILSKLQVSDRTQAALRGVELGVLAGREGAQ
jgi:DNA-binding NarL/FixJ family response regulator